MESDQCRSAWHFLAAAVTSAIIECQRYDESRVAFRALAVSMNLSGSIQGGAGWSESARPLLKIQNCRFMVGTRCAPIFHGCRERSVSRPKYFQHARP